jgi:hypothetical protein
MGTLGTILLGVPLLIIGGTLVYGLISVWPAVAAATAETPEDEQISFFGLSYTASPDTAMILLVVFASALGSYVHAATSFGDYVGNRELRRSWTWWYLLRFWIGIAIALLFYFALRGGFLVADGSSSDLNPYGIAALAGMTGLFSKQATDKLNEVFVTLFRVAPGSGDDARANSIVSDRQPRVTSLNPQDVPSGVTETQTVTLRGEGFGQESIVRVGLPGQPATDRVTTYGGPDTLTVELLPDDLAVPGTLQLSVFDPESGDVSEPFDLPVGAPVEAPEE